MQGSIVLAVSLSPTGDWTQAAAIMTFAIPVGIFVVVATWLYFLYTQAACRPGAPGTGARRRRRVGSGSIARPAARRGSARPPPPRAAAGWRLPTGRWRRRAPAGTGRHGGTEGR